MDQLRLEVDLDLIAKLDRSTIRYTSYPMPHRFVDAFDSRCYAKWAARRDMAVSQPLSLYLHMPFIAPGCCVSDTTTPAESTNALSYLSCLHREIALQAPLFRDDARVEHVHFGGEGGAFCSADDLACLFQSLRTHFELLSDGEYSIDVGVRTVDAQAIRELRAIGFNRLSLGAQDFVVDVGRAADPLQMTEDVSELVEAARSVGFESVNIDLTCGEPRQTLTSFTAAIGHAVALRPERIAVHRCADPSASSKLPKRIRGSGPGSRGHNLKLFASAAERLVSGGYVYIGMDQFALPGDDFSVAQREGRLHWSCQGYTTHSDCDSVGFGISAIGAIGPTYSQNAAAFSDYRARLERNDLPIVRGIELTRDDLVRRNVIRRLICHCEVSKASVGVNYLVDFDRYFAPELEALRSFEHDGLVALGPDWIEVTPRGRPLVCAICSIFDRYRSAGDAAAS